MSYSIWTLLWNLVYFPGSQNVFNLHATLSVDTRVSQIGQRFPSGSILFSSTQGKKSHSSLGVHVAHVPSQCLKWPVSKYVFTPLKRYCPPRQMVLDNLQDRMAPFLLDNPWTKCWFWLGWAWSTQHPCHINYFIK